MNDADRNRRTMTDPQRMLWADDVEGICRSPDMCFEYSDHARCGPCAIEQSTRAGVAVDLSVPDLPEVYRLRRQIKGMLAQGIEAQSGETREAGLDPKDESPVAKPCAQGASA